MQHSLGGPLAGLAQEPVYFTVFAIVIAISVGSTLQERRRVLDARTRLEGLFAAIEGRPAVEMAAHLEKAAASNPLDGVSTWILAIRNSKNLHSGADASALTDAFWSREHERNALARFLAKNAILLGLIFTILGLIVAVSGIKLPDAQAGFDPTYFDTLSKQLGNTLGGMATAFYSSFFGLATNLLLSAFIMFFFERPQNAYLERVDTFFQGYAIPAFAALSRSDETERFQGVVKELSAELRASNERMEKALMDVRTSYDSQFERLAGFSEQLEKTVGAIDGAMERFQMDTKVFTIACDRFQQAAERVDSSYEAGVEKLCAAQASLEKVVEEGFGIFEALHETNSAIYENISATTKNYETVSERLSTYQEAMRAAFEANEKSIVTICERLTALTDTSAAALEELRVQTPQSIERMAEVVGTLQAGFDGLIEEEKAVAADIQAAVGMMRQQETGLAESMSQVYEDHRTAMAAMYEGMSEAFQEQMAVAAKQSAEKFVSLVPELNTRTQEWLRALDRHFGELVSQHLATVESLQHLQTSLDFNSDKLRDDLDQRRAMVSEVLTSTVERLVDGVNRQVEGLNNQLRSSLNRSVMQTSDETRAYLKELSEAVTTKYEHIIEAQLAANRRSS